MMSFVSVLFPSIQHQNKLSVEVRHRVVFHGWDSNHKARHTSTQPFSCQYCGRKNIFFLFFSASPLEISDFSVWSNVLLPGKKNSGASLLHPTLLFQLQISPFCSPFGYFLSCWLAACVSDSIASGGGTGRAIPCPSRAKESGLQDLHCR